MRLDRVMAAAISVGLLSGGASMALARSEPASDGPLCPGYVLLLQIDPETAKGSEHLFGCDRDIRD